MKDHIVEIKDVSKIFFTKSGSLELFTDVNIKFCASTSYALIGESGVGKSTLLHIASGLEKPSTGEVFVGKQNFWDLKASAQALLRLNETAIIFQQYNLIPCLSVKENIEFQSRVNKKYDTEYIKAIIDDLGLTRLLKEWPEDLSGGEQQRVAIARSLLNNPELIIADEPTGNLDPETSSEIIELFQRLNKIGTSMIIATHDYNLILKLKGKVYKCEDGKIFEVKRK